MLSLQRKSLFNAFKKIECFCSVLQIGQAFCNQPMEEWYTFETTQRNSGSVIDYIVYIKKIEQIKTEVNAKLQTKPRLATTKIKNIEITMEREKDYDSILVYKLRKDEKRRKYQEEIDTKLLRK